MTVDGRKAEKSVRTVVMLLFTFVFTSSLTQPYVPVPPALYMPWHPSPNLQPRCRGSLSIPTYPVLILSWVH